MSGLTQCVQGYQGSVLVVFRRAAKGWQARLRQGYGAQPSLFGLPAFGEGWKNVYFCFGNFTSLIKALCGIHVYFCIPSRKGRSRKIKDLAEKMSTFVYFCIPFTFGAHGFRVESTD
jgi:hypothetical protein